MSPEKSPAAGLSPGKSPAGEIWPGKVVGGGKIVFWEVGMGDLGGNGEEGILGIGKKRSLGCLLCFVLHEEEGFEFGEGNGGGGESDEEGCCFEDPEF